MTTPAGFIDAEVWPEGSLEVLSQFEVDQLKSSGAGGLYPLLRRCMLAVLHADSRSDDARELLETYRDFEVGFIQQDRGLKVSLKHAPAEAFVDGRMIRGTRELLFAVLRDIVFTRNEIIDDPRFDLKTSESITNAVFHIVRNARLVRLPAEVDLVVCWGGHAISRDEYDYSKKVGYELGLRSLNVCTGCGPGAMKGPMKGATIGHAKQRIVGGVDVADLDGDGDGDVVTAFYNLARIVWFRNEFSNPGDLTGDGSVDIDDIDLLCAAIVNDNQNPLFDLDDDDAVGLPDMVTLVEDLMQTNFGDANLDGSFDSLDLIVVFAGGQYEDQAGNATWATGDWNCDGNFDSADLIWALQTGAYSAGAQPNDGR